MKQTCNVTAASVFFRPGSNKVFAVAAGDVGSTWIYRFKGMSREYSVTPNTSP